MQNLLEKICDEVPFSIMLKDLVCCSMKTCEWLILNGVYLVVDRVLRSEHYNDFDQNVWYPQSVNILLFYVKNKFLYLDCGTICCRHYLTLYFDVIFKPFCATVRTDFARKNWFLRCKVEIKDNIDVEQEIFYAS